MSVTLNTNVNWNALVSETMKGSTLEGVAETSTVLGTDGNLTVTLQTASGATQTVTITPPELDAATCTLTEAGLEDLRAKLDGAFDALKQAVAQTAASGAEAASASNKMLFDIYALMQLMLEIAQKERAAARTERQADLSRAVSAIQNQAEQQRSAAKTGLIMSCVFSAASICAQAGAAFASSAAQTSATKMAAASGVDQAQQNLSLLSAKDSTETKANLTKIETGMTPDQKAAAQGNFADSTAAKAQLDVAKTELNAATQKRAEAQTDGSYEIDPLRRDALDERVTAAEADVAAKTTAYETALNTDQTRLEARLGAAKLELTQLESAQPVDTAAVANQKTEIANLEQQRTWGRAYVTDQKMQNGLTASLAADIESADQAFGKTTQMLAHNADYKAAMAKAQGWQTASDLLRQTGMLLESVTRGVTSMQEATATEYAAEEKTHENARAESDDLATSAQQLVQSILDLLQAVLAAENQSINQIVA